MLPLITFLNIISFTIEKFEHALSKNHNKIKYAFIALSIIIMIPTVHIFLSDYARARSTHELMSETTRDTQMADWVKNNTSANKVFITEPNDIFFYVNYERPVFATWKHAPQNGRDIIEWYNRLKALNGGKDFQNKDQIGRNFLKLSEEELVTIAESYPNVAYVLMPRPFALDFPVLFKSDKNILYEIKNEDSLPDR